MQPRQLWRRELLWAVAVLLCALLVLWRRSRNRHAPFSSHHHSYHVLAIVSSLLLDLLELDCAFVGFIGTLRVVTSLHVHERQQRGNVF